MTRSVIVRALIDNEDDLLRPGLLMRVTLQSNSRPGLRVPEGALTLIGKDAFAWRIQTDANGKPKVERVRVSLGLRRQGYVEALNGLAEGDQVVRHGGIKLNPGAPVRIASVDDKSRAIAQILQEL